MQLFKNACFISCEDTNQIYTTMVEADGKIVYLGTDIPAQYEGCPQYDLNGACVVPAFADTHIHFESFSLFLSTLDSRNVSNFEELATRIKQYIESQKWDEDGGKGFQIVEKR